MVPGMRSPRLRLLAALAALAALPPALGGCATVLGDRMDPVAAEATYRDDGSWIVVQQGKVKPTPVPTSAPRPSVRPTPAAHPTPADTSCAFTWLAGQVLIPVKAEVGTNSIAASWPRVGDPAPTQYRVAAVPQEYHGGRQEELDWKTVSAPSGCSADVEIHGLVAGKPYVIWVDAPDAGYQIDGTPRPRSGRSAVVYPT